MAAVHQRNRPLRAAGGQWAPFDPSLDRPPRACRVFFDINSEIRQGFGGYSTPINNPSDLQKALTVRDLITPQTEKILILGLGNHIVVHQAWAKLKLIGSPSFKIDVIDNFNLYYDEAFRSVVSEQLGVFADQPEIALHYTDAFQYLAGAAGHGYDLIIWNLTQPNYPASAKLYTAEGGRLIAEALKPGGIFISKLYDNGTIDCSIISAFKYSASFPDSAFHPWNTLIASNTPLNKLVYPDKRNDRFLLPDTCRSIRPITLDNYTKVFSFGPLIFRPPKYSPKQNRFSEEFLAFSESARLFNGKTQAKDPVAALVDLTGDKAADGRGIYQQFFGNNSPGYYPVVIDTSGSPQLKKRYATILEYYFEGKPLVILPTAALTGVPANARAVRPATDLSGKGAGSGTHIKNAVTLFTRMDIMTDWTLKALDSHGDEALNAELTRRLYLETAPGDVIFAPRGTKASLEYIKSFPPEMNDKRYVYFLNQVTASTAFNRMYPTVSVFLPSEKYLDGVLELMKSTLPAPRKVHILRLDGIEYFVEIENQLIRDIARLGLTQGGAFTVTDADRGEVLASLTAPGGDIAEEDWLFLLDHGPEVFANIRPSPAGAFENIQKVYIYGNSALFSQIPSGRQPAWRNSWQALFWDNKLFYAGSGRLTNCDFVKKYFLAFRQPPDFHAAYTFAAMEVAAALEGKSPFDKGLGPVNTILGEITWDSRGVRTNSRPVIFHYDSQGRETLYTSKSISWCPNMSPSEKLTIRYIP